MDNMLRTKLCISQTIYNIIFKKKKRILSCRRVKMVEWYEPLLPEEGSRIVPVTSFQTLGSRLMKQDPDQCNQFPETRIQTSTTSSQKLESRLVQLVPRNQDPDQCNQFPETRIQTSATSFQKIGSRLDRKSTRLNSSHANISYAVFCLKKKKIQP